MNAHDSGSKNFGKEFELDRFVKAASRHRIVANDRLTGFDLTGHTPFEVFMNKNLQQLEINVLRLPADKLVMKYKNSAGYDNFVFVAENILQSDEFAEDYRDFEVALNVYQISPVDGHYSWIFSSFYNSTHVSYDIAENVRLANGQPLDEMAALLHGAFYAFCGIMANPEQVVERTAPDSKIQASRKKHGKSPLPDRRTIRYIHPGQVKTKTVSGPSKGGTHRSPIEHERKATVCISKLGKEFPRRGSVVNKGKSAKLPPMNLVSRSEIGHGLGNAGAVILASLRPCSLQQHRVPSRTGPIDPGVKCH